MDDLKNIEILNEQSDISANKPLCGLCGDPHYYRECGYIVITSEIKDALIPTRARLSLPDQLEIRTFADKSEGIYTRCFIETGTEFGPFLAKKISTLHPLVQFPLKVFGNDESEYYLDTTDENECCWMMFVRTAEDVEEQNLVCYQEGNDIYFGTITDIHPGEELKIWYSPYYAFRMQTRILTFKHAPNIEEEMHIKDEPKEDVEVISKLVKEQQKIIPAIIWNCKFCSKLEKNVTRFAQHLLTHYSTRTRKDKVCHHCQKKFQYEKEYRAHLKTHKKPLKRLKSLADKPKTIETIKIFESPVVRPSDPLLLQFIDTKGPDLFKNSPKRSSAGRKVLGDTQQLNISSPTNTVGGPLLLQFNDQDSSNSCLLQSGIGSFDLGTYDQSALMDNDVLQFTNLIGSNMDEDNTVKEPDKNKGYVCDICLKKFKSRKSMKDHLSLHIGRFNCKTCKKVFGRQENYKNHKCNRTYSIKCPRCERLFYQKKYLVQHISSYHDKRFSCSECNKAFMSAFKLKHHWCIKNPKSFKCDSCEKSFRTIEGRNLHHKKIHAEVGFVIKLICPECSQIFSSNWSYLRHIATVHKKDRRFPCEKCNKVFFRSDTLKSHMVSVHPKKQEEVLKCSTCNKTFNSRRNLNRHIKQSHGPAMSFKCSNCPLTFKHQRNLLRHVKKKHQNNSSRDKDYECPVCKLKMKLKNSLQRHVRKKHPERYKNLCIEQNAKKDESKLFTYRCPKCLKTLKRKSSVKRHFKHKHENEYEKLCGQLDECIVIARNKADIKNQKTNDELDEYIDLQKTIENMDFSLDTLTIDNLIGSETIDKFLKESSDNISILLADSPKPQIPSNIVLTDRITNREVELPIRATSDDTTILTDRITNREIGLSMPNLCDIDQDVKTFEKSRAEAACINEDVKVENF